jgi:sugar lactone lactonase YvrE
MKSNLLSNSILFSLLSIMGLNISIQAQKNPKNEMKNTLKTITSDLGYGESPRWYDGKLWFCNWTMQEVVAIDENGNREATIKMPFTSFPFSIDWLPDGRMIIVSASEQPLLRLEADGSLVAHADLSSLNTKAWNEIAIDGKGNIYINGGDIIALVKPDGSVKKLVEGFLFPNGTLITKNNLNLVIAESRGKRLTAFDIEADGSLTNRRVWADLKDGAPDGICLDNDGAIWYGDVPNKRCVRVKEGGEVLQIVNLEKGCFACALGGAKKNTLFMTVAEWRGFDKMFDGKRTGQIQTVEVAVKGIRR